MAKNSDQITSLDVAIARRAVGLTVGMSGTTYSVAFALLEHLNRKSGQCDPSIARLSTMLGLGEATVKRATKELSERGLFKKTVHGGLSHRTKYVPDWGKMKAVLKDWETRMAAGSGPEIEEEKGSDVSCSRDQICAVEGLNIEPRTLWKEPYGINPSTDGASGNAKSDDADDGLRTEKPEGFASADGLLKKHIGEALRQPSRVVKGEGLRVAESAATKRWNAAMMRRGGNVYARFVDWVTAEISDQATEVEMRRRGDGERFLIDRMHAAGLITSEAR